MSKPPKYIGDAAFKRFLERYHCPTEFHEVRMRFLGEIASLKGTPQPTDAIEDVFEGEPPEFRDLDEAQGFFGTVLSLWNRMAQDQGGKIKLTPLGNRKQPQQS